jgi:sugar/nucleoside kinase (ribokinase family)
MIVVIGLPAYTDEDDGERCAGGLAVDIAAEARRRGSVVELVGKIGADGAGDSLVLALGGMGIGHAALLRDPARPTPLLVKDEMEAAAPADGLDEIEATAGAVGASGSRLLPPDPDAPPALEAADVELALRYLTGPSVIVVSEPLPVTAMAAAVDGAAFSTARLVVVTGPGEAEATQLTALSETATVLEAPVDDDGSFGRLVGAYAAALDAGEEPGKAFRDGVTAAGWEPSLD